LRTAFAVIDDVLDRFQAEYPDESQWRHAVRDMAVSCPFANDVFARAQTPARYVVWRVQVQVRVHACVYVCVRVCGGCAHKHVRRGAWSMVCACMVWVCWCVGCTIFCRRREAGALPLQLRTCACSAVGASVAHRRTVGCVSLAARCCSE
jgi:hypothetical protein